MSNCRGTFYKYVSERDCRIIKQIAGVINPVDNIIDVKIPDNVLIKEADDFFFLIGWLNRFGVKMVLFILEYFIPLMFLYFGRFSKLEHEKAYHIFQKLHDSKIFAIRGIYLISAMLVLPLYYSYDEVLKEINYDPENINKKGGVAV